MSQSYIFYKDVAPGAEETAVFSSGAGTDYSTVANLALENEVPPLATLEPNRWLLDGAFELLPRTVPYWSAALSGEDGVFTEAPVIDIGFDKQYSSVGFTLVFDTAAGEYCSLVNIKWYQGGALKSDMDFRPDNTTYFCENIVTSYDRVVITLLATSLPKRRARLNQIIFGVHRKFYMDELRSVKIVNQCDIGAFTVPISTMSWVLESRGDIQFMFQLKQPVESWNDNRLLGAYYIDSYSRSAAHLYSIDCYDAIGVLGDIPFAGGVYSGYSAKTLVRDIAGGEFELEFEVEDTTLTGVIRPGNKRDALQQVLFAWGVAASTDGRHSVRVFPIPGEGEIIGEDKTYIGASVETSAIVTEVRVTAHTYAEAANGSIEINGVKYSDTRQVFTVSNPDVTVNDKAKVVEISNATLISPDIGAATAQRVYDYYARRDTARARIVWEGETLGEMVTLPTPWQTTVRGNVTKLGITLSNTVAADVEAIG